jgi:hypothetical protein
MLAALDPTNPPLVRLLCVLDACENGLRFYELGTSAPQLAREVADALAALRAILIAAAGASIDDEKRRRQAETTRPQG